MTIAVLIRMNWALRLLVGASSMAPLLCSIPPKEPVAADIVLDCGGGSGSAGSGAMMTCHR